MFETPWGDSPPFTLFELGGHTALHVRMHGWRKGVSRGRASRQVFSVLHRAGVKRILSDAGVGSLNHLLDPGDLVVVDDFVDQTTDRDRYGVVVGDHLLIMRDPVCAAGREALVGCRPAPRPGAPRVHARHVRGHRGAALRVTGRGPSPAEHGRRGRAELLPGGLAGPRHRRLLRRHLPHRQLRRRRRAGVGARRAGADLPRRRRPHGPHPPQRPGRAPGRRRLPLPGAAQAHAARADGVPAGVTPSAPRRAPRAR